MDQDKKTQYEMKYAHVFSKLSKFIGQPNTAEIREEIAQAVEDALLEHENQAKHGKTLRKTHPYGERA